MNEPSDDRRSRRQRAAQLKYDVGDFSAKSITDDIAERFDADVERFSNLETGQSASIDAPLSMQLITEAAVRLTPNIQRVQASGVGTVTTWLADIRAAELPKESYDVVLAAAVLHHLRDDEDWQAVFEKIISVLRPGGSPAQVRRIADSKPWLRYCCWSSGFSLSGKLPAAHASEYFGTRFRGGLGVPRCRGLA